MTIRHTHVLVDHDDKYFLVAYSDSEKIDWVEIIKNLAKE